MIKMSWGSQGIGDIVMLMITQTVVISGCFLGTVMGLIADIPRVTF